MNKLKLILAVLVSLLIGKAFAGDIRNVPNDGAAPINADYGGVDIATNSFFVGFSTVPSENGSQGIGYRKFYASTTTVNNVFAASRWTIYGVIWSTGTCPSGSAGGYAGDFISVLVSSSQAGQAREVTRFYNTASISTGPVCGGGATILNWPIRVYGNLFWGVNAVQGQTVPTNPYNRSDLLYYREPD